MGRDGARIETVRKDFRVLVEADPIRLVIQSADLRQELVPQIALDTAHGVDLHIHTGEPVREEHAGFERITWSERSALWAKRYHLDVHERHVLFTVDAEGTGTVDTIRYFDSIPANGFREHFALTKHFNDHGRTTARAYSTGSVPGFTQLMCPEPNSHARQIFAPHEYAQISVNADLDYHGGNFVADPGLLAFAVTAAPERQWWAIGLATEPGQHHFSELEYLGGSDFALNLNCWGALRASGTFRPPGIVLAPGRDAEAALAAYVRVLADSHLVPRAHRQEAPWWQRPIVCGWGHQAWQGDLFRIRSSPERPRDNAVYTLCTELNYRDITERMDTAELPWGTLVVDARWFSSGGLKNPDTGRWPNLAGFVAQQHRAGRKVLLWWGPWDPEGTPAQECVRWRPELEDHPNRPGRLAKFGTPDPGAKIGVDITLPQVRDRIRRQVHHLLGSGPGCVDADGLKIDHQSAAPGLYGMDFPDDSGRLFGIEAAHEIQRVIYEAAKEAKPDALIVGQSPNPYFADVQDMLRLGDIYSHRADSVLEEMAFRARMARTADPGILIDTDGWPLPSLAAWREYTAAQPALGVPSLYYASHLDTTGEALTAADFALLRRTWRPV
jgi:hypothetical protein